MKIDKSLGKTPSLSAQLLVPTAMLGLVGFSLGGCEPQKNEPATRLVYLAPFLPCEAGEKRVGESNCFTRRKRDAVMVLKIPKAYQTVSKEPTEIIDGKEQEFEVAHTLAGSIIFEPNEGVDLGKVLGKAKEWAEREKIAIKNLAAGDLSGLVLMSWTRWGVSFSEPGYQAVRDRMKSNEPKGEDGAYVEIPSYITRFKMYDQVRCIDHFPKRGAVKGGAPAASPCDYRNQFFLAIDDTSTYLVCPPRYYLNDVLTSGFNCNLHSAFKVGLSNGKPVYLHYNYNPGLEYLQSDGWKYINKRFEAWIRSMDVTEQELSRSKK